MAKPLEFEYVVRCKDPDREVKRLLEAQPSLAARETLKRVEKLYREGLRLNAAREGRSKTR